MSTAIKTYADLVKSANALMQPKTASSPMGGGTNPDSGPADSIFSSAGASAEKTDGDNKKKLMLPKDGEQGKAGKDIATEETKPSPVGENVPSTTTQPAIDPNPDFNTKKLAGKAAELAKRAAALMGKSAAAHAPAVIPAAAPAAPVAKVAGSSVDNLINPRDPQFHFKLASFVLENEDVLMGVQEAMERKLGAEEALGAIKNAYVAHAQFIEATGQQAQWEKQAAAEQAMIKEAFDKLSPADQKQTLKFAAAHEAARNGLNPELNAAYNQGILDADFILSRTTKSAAAGAPPEAAGPAEIPTNEFPGAKGPEEQADPQEIIAVLEQLVQEGKIPMEEAQQVAQALMGGAGGGEGGGPEGGTPPMDAGAGAGGPPAAESGAEEADEPEAIAKKAAALLGINR